MKVMFTRALIALSALALAVGVAAPPAMAKPNEPTPGIVDRALRAVATVDPSPTTIDVEGSTATRLTTDKVGAVIADSGRGSMTITLESARKNKVSLADSDSSTSRDVANDTDAEVRVVPGGAQLFSVIRDPSASSEQRYRVQLPAGTRLSRLNDGGYLVLNGAGSPVGRIEAPWAVDAAGSSLPTRYTLQGNVLVQSIETTNAVFPIVADPKVTYGISIYVRYQRAEVKDFKDRGKLVVATTLVAAACSKIPVGWLALACGTSAAVVSNSVFNTFSTAAGKNRCVELTFNYQGIILTWKTKTKGSWCK